MKKYLTLLISLILTISINANAAPRAAKILDISDKLALQSDKNENIIISGLIVPKEYKEKVRSELKRLVAGKNLKLEYGAKEKDRYNNFVAHAYLANGKAVEEELLRKGLAVTYPKENNSHALNMLAAEKYARQNNLGLWADENSKLLKSNDVEKNIAKYRNKFRVVEGTIASISKVRDNYYLNFGENWKNDFTIKIGKKDLKQFEKMDLTNLSGKNVRVRGWIELYNGPLVKIYNPAQLEIL